MELADLREGQSVLDVGSGRGATLLPAAGRVGPTGRVLGVDLSEEMVGLLGLEIEHRGVTNAEARRMDAEALDVADNSFDVALSSFVLHLLPHPDAAAGELRRVLRPGGRVAASAPTGAGRQWDFLMRLFRRFAPRATRSVPLPIRANFDLASILSSAGFEVLRSIEEQMEFRFADEQAWWEWAWSHGMRALFEALAPSDLDQLRDEAFSELVAFRTPQGVPMNQTVTFVVAQKPS
ncbi:MAG: methyltransferase domain-containing protein [Actinomycetota bacterium]|nr:methyltransferase domain-containing protein [Actinomycetota bacterium]